MSNRLKGICFILCSAFCFSLMNLCVSLATEVPTVQKVFFRNFISFLVAVVLLTRQHKKRPISLLKNPKTHLWIPLFLRASFGTIGIYTLYEALERLYISDATVLNKLSPVATLLFSALFLKEPFHKKHMFSLFIVFLGVIFVVKPTLASSDTFAYIIAILSGVIAGISYTCVRYLSTHNVEPGFTVVFFSAFSCLFALPELIQTFTMPSNISWLLLILIGATASAGQFAITIAYQFAPASEIAIFDYTSILFTGILGFIFLNQLPDTFSLIGYTLMCLGGGYAYTKIKPQKNNSPTH